MCFSQYASYQPRPVKTANGIKRPKGAKPTKADMDKNLFGPKPLPPEWQEDKDSNSDHNHTHDENGEVDNAIKTAVKSQTVEATVVELPNGTRLLICPL